MAGTSEADRKKKKNKKIKNGSDGELQWRPNFPEYVSQGGQGGRVGKEEVDLN